MDPRPNCHVGDIISINGEIWNVVNWIVDSTGIKVTYQRNNEKRSHYLDTLRSFSRRV